LKFKKVLELLIGILVVTLGVLAFDFLIHLFEILHGVSKPIYQEIYENRLSSFEVKHVISIFYVLMLAVFLVFIFQFFKSLFDKSIKKLCDTVAEALINKFEKWTEK